MCLSYVEKREVIFLSCSAQCSGPKNSTWHTVGTLWCLLNERAEWTPRGTQTHREKNHQRQKYPHMVYCPWKYQEKGDFVQGQVRHGHLSPQGLQGERRAPCPWHLEGEGTGHPQALLGCGGICHQAQQEREVKNMKSHHRVMLVMPVAKKGLRLNREKPT